MGVAVGAGCGVLTRFPQTADESVTSTRVVPGEKLHACRASLRIYLVLSTQYAALSTRFTHSALSTQHPALVSLAGPRHSLAQHRSALARAAHDHVGADRDDVPEHVLEISGHGDFLHGMGDFAVLDPEPGGSARVVAGDHVDPLPQHVGEQQAGS